MVAKIGKLCGHHRPFHPVPGNAGVLELSLQLTSLFYGATSKKPRFVESLGELVKLHQLKTGRTEQRRHKACPNSSES